MGEQQTILLAGGGTGGHLYPGISVAQALAAALPDARVLFLCTRREIDQVILQPTGFEFIPQPIVPPVKTVTGLLRFWKSWRETKDLIHRILGQRKPVAALGLGGYAAGVAVKLAALEGIPAAILNPDVIPGKANQYLMRYVQKVCCQFESTASRVRAEHRAKISVTGCPIRSEMRSLPSRAAAAAALGLDHTLSTLMITGASLGAQTVNEAVLATLPNLRLQGWQILHLTGREHAAVVGQGYRQRNIPARIVDFTPDMANVYAVSDLAICRAGASTCAELTACGVPAIFMPYPFHKDMHQRANAMVLADAQAAIVMDDAKDARKNAERLQPLLEPLLYDAARRQTMAQAARRLGRPDAAEAVAQVVALMIESKSNPG